MAMSLRDPTRIATPMVVNACHSAQSRTSAGKEPMRGSATKQPIATIMTSARAARTSANRSVPAKRQSDSRNRMLSTDEARNSARALLRLSSRRDAWKAASVAGLENSPEKELS